MDDEFPSIELETKEDELAERATAARTILELSKEIQTLKRLTEMAQKVFRNSEDKKWPELSELLQDKGKILNSKGEQIARVEGAIPKEQIVQYLEEGLK